MNQGFCRILEKGLVIKLTFFFFLFSWSAFSQKTYTNEVFGFTVEVPDNWGYYGSTEFVERNIEGILAFYLPSTKREPQSEWDNSAGFVAKANGYAHSLADAVTFERQRLHRKFDDLEVLEESGNRLLTRMTINDVKYNTFSLVAYQNGISYVASYNYQSNEENSDSASFISVFNNISYFVPTVNYNDISAEIAESPEDATLYFKRAQRAFHFHELEPSLEDVNTAIELFPFYGEAFYLRGYIFLALGDTVEACKSFHSAVYEDYDGEMELDEYCNTREMAEALEKGRERPNPFEGFDSNANHLEYVDSVKTHEYLVLSTSGEPNGEVLSYMSHVNHLFMLDYVELDSIFQANMGIVRLYSFGILCRKFPDQVNKAHRKILKDRGEVMVLSSEREKPYAKPIKELASRMYGIIEAIEAEKKMRAKTEAAVNKFIRKYAKDPESYESVEFEEFHEMHTAAGISLEKEKDSETYIIRHRYRIKDVNGNLQECFNTFKFDYEFQINIIEREESNTISSYPPRIMEWLEKYGRELTDRDKKKLGIQD